MMQTETMPSILDSLHGRDLGRHLERNLHKSLYLSLQLLRGRPVGLFVNRLRRWDGLDPASYAELAQRRLADILMYASDRVPLYRSRNWAGALSPGERVDVRNWPLLGRQTLVEQRRVLLARPVGPTLISRNSSASTGTPVTVSWNPVALAWSWAAEYHPMLWHQLGLGVRTLRLWGSGKPLENWVLNRHFVPAHDLSSARLDSALQYIETRRPDLVWGSPSAVVELARHAARRRSTANTPGVRYAKVGGEQLYPFQREEIESSLGARVIEAYGCTEVGPIAAECRDGSMHVLSANVHIEIFRNGAPVPDGELGEIVATTLINRGMPLVRCAIGDLGRLSPDPCRCGLPQPVLAELRGRAADLLLKTDGSFVHGSVLGSALHGYVGKAPLGEAQKILFEQLDRTNWKVHVESEQCTDAVALDRQVTELVRGIFGHECRVEIAIVTRIRREPSGKFRYYRAATGLRTAAGSRPERLGAAEAMR